MTKFILGEPQHKKPAKGPHPIDVYAGSMLRKWRITHGVSQEALAEKVNLTFQQIQKYERGANRMGASRLQAFSDILKVPVTEFFPVAGDLEIEGADMRRRDMELIRSFQVLPEKVQVKCFELIKATANEIGEA